MMSELKPCPLCGGSMRVRTNRDWHRLVGDHAENCLLQDFEPYYAATSKDREALISAWNRRSPSPSVSDGGEKGADGVGIPQPGQEKDHG